MRNKYEAIPHHEIRGLVAQAQRGDMKARDRLIVSFQPLVFSTIGKMFPKFQVKGLTREDLSQEGTIGLITAISLFDDTKGAKFTTFAVWYIRAYVFKAVFQGNMVKIFSGRSSKVYWRANSSATDEELAEISSLPVEEVQLIRAGSGCVSLEAAAVRNRVKSVKEGIYNSVEEQMIDRISLKELSDVVEESIGKESAKKREILKRRLDGETLQAIAIDFSISRERVRQLEESMLRKLRKAVA